MVKSSALRSTGQLPVPEQTPISQGYKQTEVGVIPEDWRVQALPEVARFRSGKAHEQYISEFGHYVCVNSKFISTDGAIRKYTNVNCSPGKRGDILMVMSDLPNGKALAKAFLVDRDNLYAVNQRVCALTPYRDYPKYLFYVLNRNPYFLKFDDGVNQTHLLNPIFKKCLLPLPPTIREQEAIAEALSEADVFIESLATLLAKKRQIKQGAMQELLSGRRRLPGYSSEWNEKPLKDTAPLQRGFDLPNPKLRAGPYPVVYSNGMLNSHAEFQVRGPGIVTGRSGTIGTVTFVESNYWPHNTSLWVTSFKGNDPRFIFYLFTFIGFERFATGSGVPTLNRNDAHSFRVQIPEDVGEQVAIAAVLSEMDAELSDLESKLIKAREIKQGMMQTLLSGKVRLI